MLRPPEEILYDVDGLQRFAFVPTWRGQVLDAAPDLSRITFYTPEGVLIDGPMAMQWDQDERAIFVTYEFKKEKFPAGYNFRANIEWRRSSESPMEKAIFFFDVVRSMLVPMVSTQELYRAEPVLRQVGFTADDSDLSAFLAFAWDELKSRIRSFGVPASALLMSSELAPVHRAIALKYAMEANGMQQRAEFWQLEAESLLKEVMARAKVDANDNLLVDEQETNLTSVEVQR